MENYGKYKGSNNEKYIQYLGRSSEQYNMQVRKYLLRIIPAREAVP